MPDPVRDHHLNQALIGFSDVGAISVSRGRGTGERSNTPEKMLSDVFIATVFPGVMVFAALSDLLTMRIPNRLITVLTAGFFFGAALTGLGWADIGVHVGAALAALALSFTLFWLGGIGGGDAKLFVATSLWVGPQLIVTYSLYTSILGMGLALIILFWRALRLPSKLAGQGWLVRLHSPKEGIPYGIALGAAGLLIYPSTPFLTALVN